MQRARKLVRREGALEGRKEGEEGSQKKEEEAKKAKGGQGSKKGGQGSEEGKESTGAAEVGSKFVVEDFPTHAFSLDIADASVEDKVKIT